MKEILSADMATLGRWAHLGITWWLEQLREMTQGGARRSHLVSEMKGDALVCYLLRDGAAHPVPGIGKARDVLPQTFFSMPPADALVREVVLPALSTSDLRRLIALDMDRLTPLRSEDVVFDLTAGEAVQGGRRRYTVGIAKRKTLQACLDNLQSRWGGMPGSIGLANAGTGTPQFDFLKVLRNPSGTKISISSSGRWWLASALLALANFGLLLAHDVSSVHGLKTLTAEQRPKVVVAERLRRDIETEIQARRQLLQRRAATAPLPLLAKITHAVPDGAYALRLEWNGETVHLTGLSGEGVKVPDALEASHAFRSVRPHTKNTKPADGIFDVAILPKPVTVPVSFDPAHDVEGRK